jgi:L-ascorbate metabolism protein UlaG (beta-lactamase superfamily)
MTTSLTRVVHSSVLLQFDDILILTDPWLSEKPGYRQGEPRAYAAADQLPVLDGILVSHDHYDHFDLDALAAYPDKTTPMVVKRGLRRKAAAAGWANITELDPWEHTTIGSVMITATPAKHKVPEVTYLLEGDGHTVFFGADTLHIPALHEVATRFPEIDLALMPINGLTIRPLLNKQVVMSATEAAELTALLHPRIAVPIHYAFTAGALRERLLVKLQRNDTAAYADAVAQRAPDTTVQILQPGRTLTL